MLEYITGYTIYPLNVPLSSTAAGKRAAPAPFETSLSIAGICAWLLGNVNSLSEGT